MFFHHKYGYLLLSGIIAVAIFITDLVVPLGNLVGGLYAFAVMLASLGKERNSLIAIVVACALLAFVGSLRLAGEEANALDYLIRLLWIALASPFAFIYCSTQSDQVHQHLDGFTAEHLGYEVREIAHEMSNVLQVILGLAFMLQEDLDSDDPRRSDLEVMVTSARNGSALTEKLGLLGRQVQRTSQLETSTDTASKTDYRGEISEALFP
ncbi:hypothetical protein Pan97_18830 [Bremerella volcania]|uniref:histidine kinase n=2 Tax=Bremerella volcania TaxID=2527984 RepID=A0A518C6K7_9BACT|nr:hypothetical protein Pan97_18830 [Bremerella volcania]